MNNFVFYSPTEFVFGKDTDSPNRYSCLKVITAREGND